MLFDCGLCAIYLVKSLDVYMIYMKYLPEQKSNSWRKQMIQRNYTFYGIFLLFSSVGNIKPLFIIEYTHNFVRLRE